MQRILGFLFCVFVFLAEETFFSGMGIRDVMVGNLNLLAIGWFIWGLLLALSGILAFLIRRKELVRAYPDLKRESSYTQEKKVLYFDAVSGIYDKWTKRNRYYHSELWRLFRFIVPERSSVMEIGCGTGHLLERFPGDRIAGVDISQAMIDIAKRKYPHIQFWVSNAENLELQSMNTSYDYLIMSDLIGHLNDVQKAFEEGKKLMHEDSRLIITSYSYLWEPVLRAVEKVYWKMPQFRQNWLSMLDIENLAELAGLEAVKKGTAFLFPLNIPILSWLLNKYIVRLPFFRHFGMVQYLVARRKDLLPQQYSVSVVVPARNESGNIEKAVTHMPQIGKFMEIIFAEGHSTDNTWEEIQRVYEKYKKSFKIKAIKQPGQGKADAVRVGFREASGDIVTILDGDLTVSPEDLLKFYNVIALRQADFANGCRLIYPMQKGAMRFLNVLGNKFFSLMFTWLLDQPIKDTLCGTKMLLKKRYDEIAENRSYFGDFDPFGDFDLLFGASKLNLKIKEVPIRYRARTYGETNIQRWRHGVLLLKMVFFAMRKIKFY